MAERTPNPDTGASAGDEFVVTRVFDAPRDLVWRAWTETDRLQHWWGPAGMTNVALSNDLRPGGTFHYRMQLPNGTEWWGKWVYREVAPQDRLAFVVSFSDVAANILRAPFSATWPLEVLSTITFTPLGNRTELTLRGVPVNATEAERQTFQAGFGSMQQGWRGTLDQLADFLAAA